MLLLYALLLLDAVDGFATIGRAPSRPAMLPLRAQSPRLPSVRLAEGPAGPAGGQKFGLPFFLDVCALRLSKRPRARAFCALSTSGPWCTDWHKGRHRLLHRCRYCPPIFCVQLHAGNAWLGRRPRWQRHPRGLRRACYRPLDSKVCCPHGRRRRRSEAALPAICSHCRAATPRSYVFRVANKDMTYAQQLRDYENAVIQKRFEELSEEEVDALMGEIYTGKPGEKPPGQ